MPLESFTTSTIASYVLKGSGYNCWCKCFDTYVMER